MRTTVLLPPDIDTSRDPWLTALTSFERAAQLLDLEPAILQRLKHCERETCFNFPLTRDNGEVHSVAGLIVRHCSPARKQTTPVLVSPSAFLNGERATAMLHTWAAALCDLPCGGAATALITDPQTLSEYELRSAIRGLAHGLAFGGNDDLLLYADDLGQQPLMEWLAADLANARSSTEACVFPEREKLIAFGWLEILRRVIPTGSLMGLKVAVQGFSGAAIPLCNMLHLAGARIVGVSESSGALLDPLSLDPAMVETHLRREGVLQGYGEAESARNADLLECECDVLVLADGEHQVHELNVERIHARTVFECIQSAVAPAVMPVFEQAGKCVVPSLLATVPAVVVAHASITWPSVNRIRAEIRRAVRGALHRSADAARKWSLPLSQAAEVASIASVAARLRAQGR